MSNRIQLQRTKGWRKPDETVLVARRSRWGNPFVVVGAQVIGRPWSVQRERILQSAVQWVGDEVIYSSHSSIDSAIEHAVDLFRTYCTVTQRDKPTEFDKWIAPLCGHNLGCWCSLNQPCHADVLLEFANASATTTTVAASRLLLADSLPLLLVQFSCSTYLKW